MADKEYTIDSKNMGLLDSIRTVGGHVVETIVDTPALPARLYKLYSDAQKYIPIVTPFFGPAAAINQLLVDDKGNLPGYESANAWDKSVTDFAHGVGSDVAGREIKTGGPLSNDPDVTTADKVGSVFSFLANMIPVTGGPIKRALEAAEQVKTGVKYVDDVIPAAANVAAFMSPLVPTRHPKTLIAANAALGGGLLTGVDALGNKIREDQSQGSGQTPETAGPLSADEFIAKLSAADKFTKDQIMAGTDEAVKGVGQLFDSKAELKGSQEPTPLDADAFIKSMSQRDVGNAPAAPRTSFDIGNYQGAAMGVGALAIGGAVAGIYSGAIRKKMLETFGGKEFSAAAAQDAVSKPNASNLSIIDVIRSQGQDAGLPLVREASDSKKIRGLFEEQTVASNVHFSRLISEGKFGNGSNTGLARPLGETVEDFKTVLGPDLARRQKFIDTANALAEKDNVHRAWLKEAKNDVLNKKSVDDADVGAGYAGWLAREKSLIDPKSATYADDIAKIESKHSFNTFAKSYDDLNKTITDGMADPDIARLINSYKDITQQSLKYMLEQKAITKKEFADMTREHPNYFPVRVDGKHMSALDLSSEGGRLLRGDTTRELFPFIEEVVRTVANSKLRTAFAEDVIASAKSGNKRAQELLGRTDMKVNQINKHNQDKLTVWRDREGNPQVAEFRDPLVRMALSGKAGTAAIRMTEGAMKVFTTPARFTEWVNTGPATAFVGSPFAPIGAAYSTGGVLMNRQVGMAAGLVDRFVQDYVSKPMGMKFGLRADPTFIAQVGAQMLASTSAILAKNAAGAIENVVKNMSWLRSSSSPSTVDTLAKSLSNYYKASTVHTMEKQGLYGGATNTVTRVAPTMKELESSLTVSVRTSEGWKNIRNFVHDILGAIGNAPQAAYYKQNVGRVSDKTLVSNVRNVLGDPTKSGLGTSGFGKLAVGATTITPWGNVAVQSMVALASAYKHNPAGTTMAIVTGVALPSILITNYVATLGPEYVKYQFMTRTAEQNASSYWIPIPGFPPEQGIEIPVDQPVRWAKVLADTLYGYQTGLADGSLFDPKNEAMRESFMDAMKARYYSGNPFRGAMGNAIDQMLPPIPSVMNVGMAAMGADQIGRSYLESPIKIVENKKRGATDSTSRIVDNKWFGVNVSAEFEAVFNSLGGQVARAVSDTMSGAFGASKQGVPSEAIRSDIGERFGMRVDKSTRMFGGLWSGATATISPSQEAISRTLVEQKKGLEELSAAAQQLGKAFGQGETVTGNANRGFSTLPGPGPVPFQDKEMRELAGSAKTFMTKYNTHFASKLGTLYETRASAMANEKVPPRMKQEMVNNISKEIIEWNTKALGSIQHWKWTVSKRYNRDIDLRRIKLDEPIGQFKPLLE